MSASTRPHAGLFQGCTTRAEAMLNLGVEGLKAHIKTIGLFNTKAKNVIALSEMLLRGFRWRSACRSRRAG